MSAFMTASAASALPTLLASVSLSISSPTNYHYVAIPAERVADDAAFEGVGLKEEDHETLLRYEDAAFINEAFAERVNVGTTNGLGSVVVDGSLVPPTNVVLSSATPFRRADVIIEDGWTTNNAPAKVILENVDFGIKWSTKVGGPSLTPVNGGDAWLSYCPQVVVTNVEAVYRNVKRLSRLVPNVSYDTTSCNVHPYKSGATYEWTSGGFQEKNRYAEGSWTNTTSSFVVERHVAKTIHILQPYEYNNGDSGLAWYKYGSAFRYEKEDESNTECAMTNTAIKITTQFATPVVVKGAYAFLSFKYETTGHPDYANGRASGWIRYVAKANVGTEDGTNLVATVKAPLDGSVSANALLKPAFEKLGVRYFASPSALTVDEPDSPPDNPTDVVLLYDGASYGYVDSDSVVAPTFRLELSGIILVLDVDFNARVLDEGEE